MDELQSLNTKQLGKEFKQTRKDIKSKDIEIKKNSILKLKNFRYFTEGDVLLPLLEACKFKKLPGDEIKLALQTLINFLEADKYNIGGVDAAIIVLNKLYHDCNNTLEPFTILIDILQNQSYLKVNKKLSIEEHEQQKELCFTIKQLCIQVIYDITEILHYPIITSHYSHILSAFASLPNLISTLQLYVEELTSSTLYRENEEIVLQLKSILHILQWICIYSPSHRLHILFHESTINTMQTLLMYMTDKSLISILLSLYNEYRYCIPSSTTITDTTATTTDTILDTKVTKNYTLSTYMNDTIMMRFIELLETYTQELYTLSQPPPVVGKKDNKTATLGTKKPATTTTTTSATAPVSVSTTSKTNPIGTGKNISIDHATTTTTNELKERGIMTLKDHPDITYQLLVNIQILLKIQIFLIGYIPTEYQEKTITVLLQTIEKLLSISLIQDILNKPLHKPYYITLSSFYESVAIVLGSICRLPTIEQHCIVLKHRILEILYSFWNKSKEWVQIYNTAITTTNSATTNTTMSSTTDILETGRVAPSVPSAPPTSRQDNHTTHTMTSSSSSTTTIIQPTLNTTSSTTIATATAGAAVSESLATIYHNHSATIILDHPHHREYLHLDVIRSLIERAILYAYIRPYHTNTTTTTITTNRKESIQLSSYWCILCPYLSPETTANNTTTTNRTINEQTTGITYPSGSLKGRSALSDTDLESVQKIPMTVYQDQWLQYMIDILSDTTNTIYNTDHQQRVIYICYQLTQTSNFQSFILGHTLEKTWMTILLQYIVKYQGLWRAEMETTLSAENNRLAMSTTSLVSCQNDTETKYGANETKEIQSSEVDILTTELNNLSVSIEDTVSSNQNVTSTIPMSTTIINSSTCTSDTTIPTVAPIPPLMTDMTLTSPHSHSNSATYYQLQVILYALLTTSPSSITSTLYIEFIKNVCTEDYIQCISSTLNCCHQFSVLHDHKEYEVCTNNSYHYPWPPTLRSSQTSTTDSIPISVSRYSVSNLLRILILKILKHIAQQYVLNRTVENTVMNPSTNNRTTTDNTTTDNTTTTTITTSSTVANMPTIVESPIKYINIMIAWICGDDLINIFYENECCQQFINRSSSSTNSDTHYSIAENSNLIDVNNKIDIEVMSQLVQVLIHLFHTHPEVHLACCQSIAEHGYPSLSSIVPTTTTSSSITTIQSQMGEDGEMKTSNEKDDEIRKEKSDHLSSRVLKQSSLLNWYTTNLKSLSTQDNLVISNIVENEYTWAVPTNYTDYFPLQRPSTHDEVEGLEVNPSISLHANIRDDDDAQSTMRQIENSTTTTNTTTTTFQFTDHTKTMTSHMHTVNLFYYISNYKLWPYLTLIHGLVRSLQDKHLDTTIFIQLQEVIRHLCFYDSLAVYSQPLSYNIFTTLFIQYGGWINSMSYIATHYHPTSTTTTTTATAVKDTMNISEAFCQQNMSENETGTQGDTTDNMNKADDVILNKVNMSTPEEKFSIEYIPSDHINTDSSSSYTLTAETVAKMNSFLLSLLDRGYIHSNYWSTYYHTQKTLYLQELESQYQQAQQTIMNPTTSKGGGAKRGSTVPGSGSTPASAAAANNNTSTSKDSKPTSNSTTKTTKASTSADTKATTTTNNNNKKNKNDIPVAPVIPENLLKYISYPLVTVNTTVPSFPIENQVYLLPSTGLTLEQSIQTFTTQWTATNSMNTTNTTTTKGGIKNDKDSKHASTAKPVEEKKGNTADSVPVVASSSSINNTTLTADINSSSQAEKSIITPSLLLPLEDSDFICHYYDPTHGPSRSFWKNLLNSSYNDYHQDLVQSTLLHSALYGYHSVCIDYLLSHLQDHELDINVTNQQGMSPFMYALLLNHTSIMNILINTCDHITVQDTCTSIYQLITHDDKDVSNEASLQASNQVEKKNADVSLVPTCISAVADRVVTSSSTSTAVAVAAINSTLNINHIDNYQNNILKYSFLSPITNLQLSSLSISNDSSNHDSYAANNIDYYRVNNSYIWTASSSSSSESIPCYNYTLLKHLLEHPTINLSHQDSDGNHILHWLLGLATMSIHMGKRHIQLSNVIDKTVILDKAYQDIILDMFQIVTRKDPYLINVSNIYGITPLHMVCYLGHTDLIQYILKQENSHKLPVDSYGFLPIHYFLLSHPVDISHIHTHVDSHVNVDSHTSRPSTAHSVGSSHQHDRNSTTTTTTTTHNISKAIHLFDIIMRYSSNTPLSLPHITQNTSLLVHNEPTRTPNSTKGETQVDHLITYMTNYFNSTFLQPYTMTSYRYTYDDVLLHTPHCGLNILLLCLGGSFFFHNNVSQDNGSDNKTTSRKVTNINMRDYTVNTPPSITTTTSNSENHMLAYMSPYASVSPYNNNNTNNTSTYEDMKQSRLQLAIYILNHVSSEMKRQLLLSIDNIYHINILHILSLLLYKTSSKRLLTEKEIRYNRIHRIRHYHESIEMELLYSIFSCLYIQDISILSTLLTQSCTLSMTQHYPHLTSITQCTRTLLSEESNDHCISHLNSAWLPIHMTICLQNEDLLRCMLQLYEIVHEKTQNISPEITSKNTEMSVNEDQNVVSSTTTTTTTSDTTISLLKSHVHDLSIIINTSIINPPTSPSTYRINKDSMSDKDHNELQQRQQSHHQQQQQYQQQENSEIKDIEEVIQMKIWIDKIHQIDSTIQFILI